MTVSVSASGLILPWLQTSCSMSPPGAAGSAVTWTTSESRHAANQATERGEDRQLRALRSVEGILGAIEEAGGHDVRLAGAPVVPEWSRRRKPLSTVSGPLL